jgi:hypothetical protein
MDSGKHYGDLLINLRCSKYAAHRAGVSIYAERIKKLEYNLQVALALVRSKLKLGL